jgi:hypothetical protein
VQKGELKVSSSVAEMLVQKCVPCDPDSQTCAGENKHNLPFVTPLDTKGLEAADKCFSMQQDAIMSGFCCVQRTDSAVSLSALINCMQTAFVFPSVR